jgi:hypothetical protein
MAADDPLLQLHLEPRDPIDVLHLTAALGSLARQYQEFAFEHDLARRTADARLLVSNVAPGSIDISFVPDFTYIVAAGGPLLAPLLNKYDLIEKFGKHLKTLIDAFSSTKPPPETITVKDCDDAINIVKPIAQNGGSQTFNIIKAGQILPVLFINTEQAQSLVESAARHKIELQRPDADIRQSVAMVWARLDRDPAKTEGTKSPDRGVIEEIDPKPHAVLFTDEMSHIKREMIDDQENPYQKVYFVDVEIVRVGDKIVAYRIMGFHGTEDLPGD